MHEQIFDTFVDQLKAAIKTTSKIGSQWAESTFQGPQVTRAQYERVLSYIESGISEGATIAAGGSPASSLSDAHKNGYFINPTIFTNVKDSMRIYREEIFGPVVVVVAFASEEEAIQRANDTTYGLGAAVFTRDLERAHRVAAEIEAGMVWVNSSQDCDPRIPFGGVKQSGIGRELGEAGLEAYTQTKAVHVNMGTKL